MRRKIAVMDAVPVPRVLVADDSAVARRFLAERLRGFGYAVSEAASGEEALAMASRSAYDLVFLDTDLGPAEADDGLRVCRQLRQRAAAGGAGVPHVVLVSGAVSPADRVRGTLAGCDAWLTKPLLLPTVTKTLRSLGVPTRLG